MDQQSLGLPELASKSVLSGPYGVQGPFLGIFGPFVTPATPAPMELQKNDDK